MMRASMRPALLVALVAACGGPRSAPPAPEPTPTYQATIRWTSFDVPHVIADDLGGLGFGQGWASAKQHLCRLADQFVRVRGERARWFGPGDGGAHLDSDFFHRHLDLDARARALLDAQSPDARAIARGWVAAYNQYVATTPADAWPEPCRGAAWVQPIEELDLARLALGLATLTSSRQVVPQLAGGDTASNAWAIGADRTESGRGLLVANPHFPWEGDLAFSELHLTVRGDLDVYGAGIPGVPMVGIGFTRHHAWTHTFSSSTRFVVSRVPAPEVTEETYTIDVRQPDGSLAKVSRTLGTTARGPVVGRAGDDVLALTDVALASAGSAIDLYLQLARAESFDAFRAALAHRATPFLNTLYADVEGNAWYVDGSAVPDLSDEGIAMWRRSRTLDRTIPSPGAIPIGEAPELLRRDFVMNANDSYRFTNPAAPLAGFSPLYGDPDAEPSMRTLANLRLLTERGATAFDGGDGWNHREAAAAMLSNRSFTGEQLRDEVLARCRAAGDAAAPLCTRLAEWDLQFDVGSRGALLWRELMKELASRTGLPWARPYDPADRSTPSGLAADVDVGAALGRAADRLAARGIDVRAGAPALGEHQRAAIGDRPGVPGGDGLDGVANVVTWRDWNGTLLPRAPRGDVAYPVNYGTSWVMSVDLLHGGPDAAVLLTYGPGDQLERFARGELRPALFDDEQIQADPALVVEEIASR